MSQELSTLIIAAQTGEFSIYLSQDNTLSGPSQFIQM
jgi:hypothetical protein